MGGDDLARIEQQIAQLREELRTGIRKEPKRTEDEPTVRELFQQWEDDAPARKDWVFVRSAKGRLLDMEISVNGWTGKLGDLPYPRCDHSAAKAWRNKRKKQTTIRKGPPAPKTRDRELSVLHSMFTYHLDAGTITMHPLAGLPEEAKKGEGARRGFYTDEQFMMFIRVAHPLFAKMATLAYTCGGMRRDEVRLLNDTEVSWGDRERGNIHIPASRAKNSVARDIPIPPEIYDMLKTQRDAAPLHPSGVHYLFPSPSDPRGGPVPWPTMHEWLVKAREASGLSLLGETPTFHHLRHSWAKNMVEGNVPVPWVMDTGGWTSVAVAMKYMKMTGEKVDRMRDEMGKLATPITKRLSAERRSAQANPPTTHATKKPNRADSDE